MHTTSSSRFFYGWIVVGVTTLVLLVAAGVRSAPGVFLLPVQWSTGWDRTTIAFAASFGLLMYGLVAPFTGWLIGRFGLRNLTLLGLLLTGGSMALSFQVSQPWHLSLLWGLLSGVGTGMVSSVLSASVAMRWFIARRGLVVGIFGAAISAGQLVFVPLLMTLAAMPGMGWRMGALIIGVISLLVMLPVLFLLRDDPADMGLRPYGASDASPLAPAPQAEQHVMRRAVRSSTFWLLVTTFFVCGATSNGLIGTHLIPYAIECGIPQVAAASSLALMGAMNFIGTIASGWFTDKYDPRKLLCIFYGFRGLSLLFLPFINDPLGLAVFATIFGLDYIATVPPTTALVADTFGRRNVGIVYGWIFCAHQLGAAVAAWLGGVARDTLGDYTLAFLTAGVIAIVAALLSLGIGRAQERMLPARA